MQHFGNGCRRLRRHEKLRQQKLKSEQSLAAQGIPVVGSNFGRNKAYKAVVQGGGSMNCAQLRCVPPAVEHTSCTNMLLG